MLFEKFDLRNIDYKNGYIENMKIYDEFYYDKDNLLKCPDCNNLVFFVENGITHLCQNKNTIC